MLYGVEWILMTVTHHTRPVVLFHCVAMDDFYGLPLVVCRKGSQDNRSNMGTSVLVLLYSLSMSVLLEGIYIHTHIVKQQIDKHEYTQQYLEKTHSGCSSFSQIPVFSMIITTLVQDHSIWKFCYFIVWFITKVQTD